MEHKKNGNGASRSQVQQDARQGSVVSVVYHIPSNGASVQRSELHQVAFPAQIVMSRWNARTQQAVAFADTMVLWSDQELEQRFAAYEALEAAGAIPYRFQVVEAAQVDEVLEGLKEEMEREQDWRAEQLFRQAVHVGVG